MDAFNESDGFPYNFFAFFNQSGRSATKIEVKAGAPASDVLINLGQKAAKITITLTDADGVPIKKSMGLTFSRDEMIDIYKQSAAAPYTMLVPCVPFSFSVEVEGYPLWRSERITLQAGDMRDIPVKLQTK